MPNLRPIVLAAGLLTAGAVVAAEATNEAVIARQALMKEIAASAKVLGDMAQSKAPFAADAASAAIGGLTGNANLITDRFEAEETDPESKAKPEIWFAYDEFSAKAEALFRAALMADVGSLEGVQASMAAIGDACKACHQDFRNSN